MPLVNILPILIVLSMIKIIYSHKFMIKKSSILIVTVKMHIITSLHLQKEIDLKTNKTNKSVK